MGGMSRMCGLCNNPKPSLGGKIRFVLGLRRWICRACVEKTKGTQ